MWSQHCVPDDDSGFARHVLAQAEASKPFGRHTVLREALSAWWAGTRLCHSPTHVGGTSVPPNTACSFNIFLDFFKRFLKPESCHLIDVVQFP